MNAVEDIDSMMIDRSKLMADGAKYFELFEKHIPTGMSGNVLIMSIGNLDCLGKMMSLNKDAKYTVVENSRIIKCLSKLFDGALDIESIENDGLDLYNIIKELDMKFDCIIMNPPYQRNLHLKILAEAIKHLKDDGTCVNLSPVRWLQDPLAKYKKNNDYHRFENSISKFCNKIELIKTEDARRLFNVELLQPLAIYKCDKKSTYSYYNKYFKNAVFIDKVFKKILSENNFEKHKCVKFSDNLKNFVLINIMAPPMKYGKPMFDAVKTWCGYFVNGKNSLGLTKAYDEKVRALQVVNELNNKYLEMAELKQN